MGSLELVRLGEESCGLTVTSETGGSELWAHCD